MDRRLTRRCERRSLASLVALSWTSAARAVVGRGRWRTATSPGGPAEPLAKRSGRTMFVQCRWDTRMGKQQDQLVDRANWVPPAGLGVSRRRSQLQAWCGGRFAGPLGCVSGGTGPCRARPNQRGSCRGTLRRPCPGLPGAPGCSPICRTPSSPVPSVAGTCCGCAG